MMNGRDVVSALSEFRALPDNARVSAIEFERLMTRIDDLLKVLGAPGDWGYGSKLGELTMILYQQRSTLLRSEESGRAEKVDI